MSTLARHAKRYMAAVRALGQIMPDQKITYFEGSPTKNEECFLRWKELNDSGVALEEALRADEKGVG